VLRDDFAPRIFFDQEVTVSTADSEFVCRAHNLSSGGLFIRAAELLPADTRVSLSFCLPDGQPVFAGARVVRCVTQDSCEPRGMALQFEQVEPPNLEHLEQFIASRMLPAAGERVRLSIDGIPVPISARTQGSWESIIAVDAELPFLRLGGVVQLAGDAAVQGCIRWVSVHVTPEDGVPRLNIGIDVSSAEQICHEVDEDADPVCTVDFAEHAEQTDRRVRDSRRPKSA
jgi:uncharacterized protein (TIGR02266 family)